MTDPNTRPPHYRWPWFVAGAVVLGIVLAVIWMLLAVKKVEQERNVNGPLPATTPVH